MHLASARSDLHRCLQHDYFFVAVSGFGAAGAAQIEGGEALSVSVVTWMPPTHMSELGCALVSRFSASSVSRALLSMGLPPRGPSGVGRNDDKARVCRPKRAAP
jgi:hypothetical protein